MALDELKQSTDPSARSALVLIIALVTSSAVVVVGLNLLDARIAAVAKSARAGEDASTQARLGALESTRAADSEKLDKLLFKMNELAADVRVVSAVAAAKQRKE